MCKLKINVQSGIFLKSQRSAFQYKSSVSNAFAFNAILLKYCYEIRVWERLRLGKECPTKELICGWNHEIHYAFDI